MFCHLGNSSSFVEQIFIWVYFNLITLSFFELLLSLTRKGFFSFMRRKWIKKENCLQLALQFDTRFTREKCTRLVYNLKKNNLHRYYKVLILEWFVTQVFTCESKKKGLQHKYLLVSQIRILYLETCLFRLLKLLFATGIHLKFTESF